KCVDLLNFLVLFQPGRTFTKSAKAKPLTRKSRSKSPSGKKKGKRAKSKEVKPLKPPVDMLSQPAMENLYYIAHGPVDALTMRGFGWSGGGGKKKKGKKGKKKK
ncbi:unnamed protein product, partial [Owenia fusiformis]